MSLQTIKLEIEIHVGIESSATIVCIICWKDCRGTPISILIISLAPDVLILQVFFDAIGDLNDLYIIFFLQLHVHESQAGNNFILTVNSVI